MKSWHRPFGLPLWLIIIVALLVLAARHALGATVSTGTLKTSFAITQFPPRIPSVNESTTITVDLSSLAGLTPGRAIDISFTTAEDLMWVGGFGADTGDLTLLAHARLTLTAGSYSATSDETWSFGPVPWLIEMNPADPVAYSGPVGYMVGPVPLAFTLTVPWGTDLSAVSLTLTDLFTVSGVNPYISNSSVEFESATLTTTSAVPEAATGLLALFGLTSVLIRRRTSSAATDGWHLLDSGPA